MKKTKKKKQDEYRPPALSKQEKKQAKLQARLQRLMARMTLLNSDTPRPDWSEHRIKMWAKERDQIVRQLRRHGIELE